MLNLNRPFLLIIITITILFSYFSFIPSPVYAASLKVTPASGTVGSTVTLHGSDFTGRTATIYFNDKVIASDAPIANNGVLEYSIARASV